MPRPKSCLGEMSTNRAFLAYYLPRRVDDALQPSKRLWQLTRCQSKLAERLFHMTRVSDEISPFDQARPPLGSYLRNGAEPFEMRGGTRLCASANHYHCHLLAKVAPKMRLAHLVLFEHREPENFNCRACAASIFCSMGLEWEIQCYGATGLPFLH